MDFPALWAKINTLRYVLSFFEYVLFYVKEKNHFFSPS